MWTVRGQPSLAKTLRPRRPGINFAFRLLGAMLHSLSLETDEIVIQKTSEIDLDVQNFERSNPNECFGTQTFKLERAGHQINGHAKG